MKVPEGVGWSGEAKPTVAQGLKIEKIADGLQHPRQLLVLPNGDVLVVEANSPGTAPVTTPKQLIAGMVKGSPARPARAATASPCCAEPAPEASGRSTCSWKGWTRRSACSGWGLPVCRQYREYHALPLRAGETRVADPGMEFTDLPDTINHHWTKALLASPDGRKLYVGVGSNSNITENGAAIEYVARRFSRWTSPAAAAASTPPACATRPACSGNRSPASCGPSSTSATRSATTWSRTT